MLDHVFTDAIGALRDAVESAMLERQAFEERFQADVLLGDLTWGSSYSLPGEGEPPRVQADLTLAWPTWAQTAYRSWYIGESPDEQPGIDIDIALRIQRLCEQPDPKVVLAVLPTETASIGKGTLRRSTPTIETAFDEELTAQSYAIEVSYEGSYELDEATLTDGAVLDDHFGAMGGWISATLVKLGDLDFDFLPPDDEN